MTTPTCGGRKHTPITTEWQRGKFGRELGLREQGKRREMKGITTEELRRHLREAGGKKLPERRTRSVLLG